jgi:hypothetical protein
MKTFIKFIVSITALLMLFGVANAADYNYWAYVYKLDKTKGSSIEDQKSRITSGITFKVLTRNTDTASTLVYFNGTTSLTNPVTTTNFEDNAVCNDQVKFKITGVSTDQVDLLVVDTNGGYSAFIEDFDTKTHSILIDETPGIKHKGTIWFSASSASATDTGVNFLPDTMIHDVRTETVTVDATETIDVGTADTADGFIDGRSVATAGYTADTGIITNGSTSDYTPDSTYGSLLYTIVAGSDAAATHGGRSYLGHIVTDVGTNDDLYYTGSAGSDTAAGYIHYWFERLR